MRYLFQVFCFFLAHRLVSGSTSASGPMSNLGQRSSWNGSLVASFPVQVQVAITQNNVDLAVESLLKVSDPKSQEYGQHWSAKKVARTFAPSLKSLVSVENWLGSAGIPKARLSRSHGRGHFLIRSTAGEVERVFNMTCSQKNETIKLECTDYTVPESVSDFVDYVTVSSSLNSQSISNTKRLKRGDSFGLHPRRQTSGHTESLNSASVNCSLYTTPSCLRELYNIYPNTNITANTSNTFGIYETAWLTWLPDDLDTFFNLLEPDLVGQRPVVKSIDGGYLQSDLNLTIFNLEPDLDFQYALALTSPIPVLDVQVGDEFVLGDLNNMLAAFDRYYCGALNSSVDPQFPDSQPGGFNGTDCGDVTPPKVLSISYTNPEDSFPTAYLRRQCTEFLKLGLMGVTVITSSGDYGTASGVAPGTCIDRSTGVSNATSGEFSPQWPAACPWITSVGGTQRLTQPTSLDNSVAAITNVTTETQTPAGETAFNIVLQSGLRSTSGGGFSNVFSIPAYQKSAISTYFDEDREGSHLATLQDNGYFNLTRGGRGFPDVSALASTYLAAVEGVIETVYGTSASAPVFASIIALINNERLNSGKGPVGFLNPVLYAYPEALNDITTGENLGCGADPAFRAAQGWDAVTGLGSPDFARLKDVFMSLP